MRFGSRERFDFVGGDAELGELLAGLGGSVIAVTTTLAVSESLLVKPVSSTQPIASG
ncbi:MAG: hypothetical protein ACKV2Q_25215 [Planctomycetaceae bacterium]